MPRWNICWTDFALTPTARWRYPVKNCVRIVLFILFSACALPVQAQLVLVENSKNPCPIFTPAAPSPLDLPPHPPSLPGALLAPWRCS